MSTHKADEHVIPAQLIGFSLSFILLIQALFIHGNVMEVLIKMKDTLFITGTTLLSIKLTRDGWEIPAAGFIILAIGWGVLFAATDFLNQRVGLHILSSAFYFVLPAMILILFFRPFPNWIKLILIVNILPFLVSLTLDNNPL